MQTSEFAKLNQGQQDMIKAFLEGSKTTSRAVIEALGTSETSIVNSAREFIESSEGRIVEAQQRNAHKTESDIAQLRLEQRRLQAHVAADASWDGFLCSLKFSGMERRRGMIDDMVGDFGQTYEWITRCNCNDTAHSPSCFVEWLATNDGIFWIRGKPGSGKSTLVDYIFRNLRPDGTLIPSLEHWKAGKDVIVLSFFFYALATEHLQNCLQGLWRSLMYQLLWKRRDLFDKALSDKDAPYMVESILKTNIEHHSWTAPELKICFTYFVRCAVKQCKLLVLVDGLDECIDKSVDLLDNLQEVINIHENIKMCCASRPEAPISHRFKDYPFLNLQDFTWKDIELYCEAKLKNTRAASLAHLIPWKADGVFLWAYVVVHDLLRASHIDDLPDLKKRLDECPTEMTELFSHILTKADNFYAKNPQPYLTMMANPLVDHEPTRMGERPIKVTVIDAVLASLGAEQLNRMIFRGFYTKISPIIEQKSTHIREQIVAHCAGLVHIVNRGERYFLSRSPALMSGSELVHIHRPGSELAYIHRTVRDFLKDTTMGQELLVSQRWSQEDASILHLTARMAQCCFLDFRPRDPDSYYDSVLYNLFSWHMATGNPFRQERHFHQWNAVLDGVWAQSPYDHHPFFMQKERLAVCHLSPQFSHENLLHTALVFGMVDFVKWNLSAVAADDRSSVVATTVLNAWHLAQDVCAQSRNYCPSWETLCRVFEEFLKDPFPMNTSLPIRHLRMEHCPRSHSTYDQWSFWQHFCFGCLSLVNYLGMGRHRGSMRHLDGLDRMFQLLVRRCTELGADRNAKVCFLTTYFCISNETGKHLGSRLNENEKHLGSCLDSSDSLLPPRELTALRLQWTAEELILYTRDSIKHERRNVKWHMPSSRSQILSLSPRGTDVEFLVPPNAFDCVSKKCMESLARINYTKPPSEMYEHLLRLSGQLIRQCLDVLSESQISELRSAGWKIYIPGAPDQRGTTSKEGAVVEFPKHWLPQN